jgi:SAM-dependent methyltransferase
MSPVAQAAVPRSPSTARIPLLAKARTSIELFRSHVRATRDGDDFAWVFDDIAAYDRLLGAHGAVTLDRARVLEIGYGARPFRLIALQSMGVDAEGVDAEAPVLDGKLREYLAAYRVNGFERLLKSIVRHVLFDSRERREFAAALRARGLKQTILRERYHVMDAAVFAPDHGYDLIVSEDVFEHIATPSLQALVANMAGWLRPGGIALIRPNIFTGITGGHALDWSRHSFETPGLRRRTEPWDHLRSRRYAANTFLNELTRAQYRELLATEFEILDEEVSLPDLGREFLTGAAAAELAHFSDEELFSNQVRMVLRRRAEPIR